MAKKLDIKVVLSKLDNNDQIYFEFLDFEEKKSLSPWVLMRYMSSSSKLSELHLITINELVNKNFNICNKYEDLSVKTLCSAGIGHKQYHPWVPPPKNGVTVDKISQELQDIHPEWDENEVNLFMFLNSHEDIIAYLIDHGVDVDE